MRRPRQDGVAESNEVAEGSELDGGVARWSFIGLAELPEEHQLDGPDRVRLDREQVVRPRELVQRGPLALRRVIPVGVPKPLRLRPPPHPPQSLRADQQDVGGAGKVVAERLDGLVHAVVPAIEVLEDVRPAKDGRTIARHRRLAGAPHVRVNVARSAGPD